MSIKTLRLSNMLQKEISQILMTEIKDKDLQFVTITNVELTSDLSYAKIYFQTLNEDKEKVLKNLNNAKGFIRSLLIKRKIEIRTMPELKFIYDESTEYGNKIDNIIDNIHKKD